MAFRPAKDQRYFIVPQYINPDEKLVVGAKNGDLGVGLELKKVTDSNNPDLHFRFHPGAQVHWMLMHNHNYVAVANSSTQDGAPIIHWQWQPSPNLRFQFIPAGNGYYRIMAVESRKMMDVAGYGSTPGTGIVQYHLTHAANQVFKLVPVPDQKLDRSPVSFVETNEMVRTGVLAVIGLVPKVGAGLKFIIGMFWTEKNKLGDFWNQMKSYVDDRVYKILTKQRLEDLTDKLTGYMKLIHEIADDPAGCGESLRDSVIHPLVVEQESYLKKSVELLPYIVGFGTIMISLRRSMVVDYHTLFGKDDPAQVAKNKVLLQQTIDRYTATVQDCVEEARKWRMGFIPDRESRDEPHQVQGVKWTNHFSKVKDNYDGWNLEWKCRTGKDPEGPSDHKQRADFAIANRRRQVEVQFDSEMSEFVRQSKLWKNFNPDAGPYVPVATRKEVGIFGGSHAGSSFSTDITKKITAVWFHHSHGQLCGLEIYEDNTTKGVHGRRGDNAEDLQLDADENINSVYGFSKDYINGLWFSTHKGKLAGAGSQDNAYFTGDIADGFNAKLVQIKGSYDGQTLQQISFVWEYTD